MFNDIYITKYIELKTQQLLKVCFYIIVETDQYLHSPV